MRILLVGLTLCLSPMAALANGCEHDQRAQISCAEGTVWDDATKSCINQTS
jgi:hypothetical protein